MLTEQELVKAYKGTTNGETAHINPVFLAGLRRVEEAVLAKLAESRDVWEWGIRYEEGPDEEWVEPAVNERLARAAVELSPYDTGLVRRRHAGEEWQQVD